MARQPRCAAPGLLHLVELRWCPGVPERMGSDELDLLKQDLGAALLHHAVSLHAYALVPSKALLLLTPTTANGPGRVVQELSRRLAARMRRSHGHQGPLLAGRFRSVILQPERHLLDAIRFVEQLPRRESQISEDWSWSSARAHLGSAPDAIVSDHPLYWQSGNTPFEREAGHRVRLAEPLSERATREFEVGLQGGWPLGDADFLAVLARQLHRRVVRGAPGRPRKLVIPSE